jgi:hypothetical protein
MRSEELKGLSGAKFVSYGYGQVEPNHLSAQRTGQIYAQLPANAAINVLENGQFVKYDYANEEVNFTGKGEWMLVYNEIKLYHDGQIDAEFALKKGDYNPRVYSPVDPATLNYDAQTRFYGGKDSEGEDIEKVTAPADRYVIDYNEDPFHIESYTKAKKMKPGTTMVPRVYKTNVGDIYTTNTINADASEVTVGTLLTPGDNGYLTVAGEDATDFVWQVVKVYTVPDGQPGAKIMRIA